jgi:uncharacterized protein YcgL (UPF0745 family)
MKYCAVYKTHKRSGVYLFVKEKDDFSAVPKSLLEQLSTPELVMVLPLTTQKTLLKTDQKTLVTALNEQGYFLQVSDQEDNLLSLHRKSLGLDPMPPKRDI